MFRHEARGANDVSSSAIVWSCSERLRAAEGHGFSAAPGEQSPLAVFRRLGGRSEERDRKDKEELHHVCCGVVDLLKGGEGGGGGEEVRPQN